MRPGPSSGAGNVLADLPPPFLVWLSKGGFGACVLCNIRGAPGSLQTSARGPAPSMDVQQSKSAPCGCLPRSLDRLQLHGP